MSLPVVCCVVVPLFVLLAPWSAGGGDREDVALSYVYGVVEGPRTGGPGRRHDRPDAALRTRKQGTGGIPELKTGDHGQI